MQENSPIQILRDKRILLGISGGIAAYKSAELVRRLKEQAAQVRVMMTPAAQAFITPLTLQALSGEPVRSDLFDQEAEAAMGHIELARWADAILIAPCSANTLAKLATGISDNLLTTVCLARDVPLAIAPAMNRLMWSHAATQANLALLRQRGVNVFGPAEGTQACGEFGAGRMLEAEQLCQDLQGLFQHQALAGRTVVISGGPTREAIDPVRFITNHSSGKMAYALAAAAHEAGAAVHLISGPVNLEAPQGVQRTSVESAEQMLQAVLQAVSGADIFVAAAAVADYRAAAIQSHKIKKSAAEWQLKLVRNPDILATVSALRNRPYCVGFAAETDYLQENARLKLTQKAVDMLAANRVGVVDSGFNSDNNALEVFYRQNENIVQQSFAHSSKSKLARQLIKLIAQEYKSQQVKQDFPHEKKSATENPR